MRSLSAALEEAMKKKAHKGGGLVHPSFPPQGAPQPAHLGSQSMVPGQGDAMGGPAPGSIPMPGDSSMNGMGF